MIVRSWAARVRYGPRNGQHWVRVVMDREVEALLTALKPRDLDAVEVSGQGRSHIGWKSHIALQYPDFDLLAPRDVGQFDVVVCEQVLEHVLDPWRATRSLADLCRPGGHVLISTPFLLRIHLEPGDYWRFTSDGLAELARSAGLEPIHQGSWGNSWCVRANRRRWIVYRPTHRLLSRWTLHNDPLNPQVVWLLARRPDANG